MKVLFLSLVDADMSDEDWYYLELNEENGDWSIVHEWHHLSIGTLTSDEGDQRYTFAEAKEKKPHVYEKALEFLKLRAFEKPWPKRARFIENVKYED